MALGGRARRELLGAAHSTGPLCPQLGAQRGEAAAHADGLQLALPGPQVGTCDVPAQGPATALSTGSAGVG